MRFLSVDDTNSFIRMIKRWGTMMILSAFLLSVFSGCAQSDSIFPQMTDVTSQTSHSSDSDTELPPDYLPEVPTLTIAAPMAQDTAEYLAQLYFLKENGLLGEGLSGSNISLSYLSSVEPDFIVEVLTTSGTGATTLSVEAWKESQMMPDIFLSDSMSLLIDTNDILRLNEYVALNALLSPSNVYIEMIDHLMYGSNIYGIPYSASVDVLFVNSEWIYLLQEEPLPYEMSTHLFMDISAQILNMNTDQELEEPVIPFLSANDMIPHMLDIQVVMEQLASDTTLNVSDLDRNLFAGLEFLRSYSAMQYSTDLMSLEEKEEWFGSWDPILSHRVVMWTGQSDDVTRWANYFPYSIMMVQRPIFEDGVMDNPHLTVYPLCISSESDYPQLAADFAAFIALDEDAIMLRMRLEVIEGFVPVVRAKRVWDASFANLSYSSSLYELREIMDQATYSNRVIDNELHSKIQEAIKEYGVLILDPNEDLYTTLALFFDELMTG